MKNKETIKSLKFSKYNKVKFVIDKSIKDYQFNTNDYLLFANKVFNKFDILELNKQARKNNIVIFYNIDKLKSNIDLLNSAFTLQDAFNNLAKNNKLVSNICQLVNLNNDKFGASIYNINNIRNIE
jgi:hypothetical protein